MYGSFADISGLLNYNIETPIGELPSNIYAAYGITTYGMALFRDQNQWINANYYSATIVIFGRKIYIRGNATNIKSCNNVTIFLTFVSTT